MGGHQLYFRVGGKRLTGNEQIRLLSLYHFWPTQVLEGLFVRVKTWIEVLGRILWVSRLIYRLYLSLTDSFCINRLLLSFFNLDFN